MTREEAIRWLEKVKGNTRINELSQALDVAIKALEPCEDAISRESLKQKLKEHHDFYVDAYGGFSNLPEKDKSRVDEITNCIAMVVNEPPVTPQQKMGRCKDCKWWKYSDGLYRRGGHAESKCPINRKEVYEGNGYCFLYEPKMEVKV